MCGRILVCAGALVLLSCSGAQPAAPESAVPVVAPEPEPEPAVADPFQLRLDKFEAVYVDMACKANVNYDPTGTLVTLREPFEWLLEVRQDKMSTTLDMLRDVIKKGGYTSVDEFVREKENIDVAKPGWFGASLTGRLLEFVEACER